MSLSATIFSSAQLTVEDFKQVILSSGGYVSSGIPHRGSISEGDSDIWLALHSKDVIEEFSDADDRQEWQDVLGDVPKVMVEINLDHTEHAKLMYLKVFLRFAKAWPCVLHDVDDSVLSCRSVLLKYKACLG